MAIKLHSLNDVKIVGRLARDPEIRYTTQGTPVGRFRVAVGRKYKDRNSGEWKEEVAWVPCTVWRDTAERCGQRLKKGSPIFVEGRLKTREWQTKEGQKRTDLEVEAIRVQFLETTGEGFEGGGASAPSQAKAPVAAGVEESEPTDNDEVPF